MIKLFVSHAWAVAVSSQLNLELILSHLSRPALAKLYLCIVFGE